MIIIPKLRFSLIVSVLLIVFYGNLLASSVIVDIGSGADSSISYRIGDVFLEMIEVSDSDSTDQFAGGSGTEEDPWQIETVEHLRNTTKNPSAYFIQIADIDLSVATAEGGAYWNAGKGWFPLSGSWSTPWSGTYDGGGFVINGLYINAFASAGRSTTTTIGVRANRQGLFSFIKSATFKNVTITNAEVHGNKEVGILVGAAEESSFINCYVSGVVKGNENVGGLAGKLQQSDITECGSDVRIQGSLYVGGLAGHSLSESKIVRSYSNGTIEGVSFVGGLAGQNGQGSILQNCYSVSIVKGVRLAGGLVGFNSDDNSQIENSYSTGIVTGRQNIGGLLGQSEGVLVNSFWNKSTSYLATCPGGMGLSNREMMKQESFTGWDFAAVWRIAEGTSYPFLQFEADEPQERHIPPILPPGNLTYETDELTVVIKWNEPADMPVIPLGYDVFRDSVKVNRELITTNSFADRVPDYWQKYDYFVVAVYSGLISKPSPLLNVPVTVFAGGTGSEEDPYLVATAEQLSGVRLKLNAYYRQIADIDLAVAPYNTGEGWESIGHYSTPFNETRFWGSFNGNGYTIANLFINKPESNHLGLFGETIQATFNNIQLTGVNINGSNFTGGIVGKADETTLNRCSAAGTIKGKENVGGLVGQAKNSTITESFSTAEVYGNIATGGLVGRQDRETTIKNSYNTGNIYGGKSAGGLLGSLSSRGWRTHPFENSYSSGFVKAANNPGGLIEDSSMNVWLGNEIVEVYSFRSDSTNSFWNTRTSLRDRSNYGDGKTTRQMVKQATFQHWDFDDIWAIREGITYPYLRWQGAEPEPHNLPVVPPPVNQRFTLSDRVVVLRWDEPADDFINVEGYNVYRNGEKINDTPVLIREYRDSGLTDWETYQYAITALFTGNETVPTDTLAVTIAVFAAGDGSKNNPYLVETARQLDAVRYAGNSHFKQTADINLGLPPWNEAEGWQPLFPEDDFRGSYDGDGHIIDSLYINRPQEDFQSLFGKVKNASLTNIGLTNIRITGAGFVGGLLSRCDESMIDNCYATGTVKGSDGVGGIVASVINSAVSGCNFRGTVQGSGAVGGLAGKLEQAKISKCYSYADVTGSTLTGGLVGWLYGNSSLSYSFSAGNVTGVQYTGGLVGGSTSSAISNSYSNSNIKGDKQAGGLTSLLLHESMLLDSYYSGRIDVGCCAGGLVGYVDRFDDSETGFVDNSFWNSDIAGISVSNGGKALSTRDMIEPDVYSEWSFSDIWQINEGSGFPYHRWQKSIGFHNIPPLFNLAGKVNNQEISATLSWDAAVTPLKYNIYQDSLFVEAVEPSTQQWTDCKIDIEQQYRYHVTAVYKLGDELQETLPSNARGIYISSHFTEGSGTATDPWRINTPEQLDGLRSFTGIEHTEKYFVQTADISLNIPPHNQEEGWLPIGSPNREAFHGSFDGAGFVIDNLFINRPDSLHQGLFGCLVGASIKNVGLKNVNITGKEYAGGLAAHIKESSISNSYTDGIITGTGSVIGGLVAQGSYSSILNSYSTTTVRGKDKVGGLIGYNEEMSVIRESYHRGKVTGGDNVGGIAGENDHSTLIDNCFSNSDVAGENNVGGLIGQNSVFTCYCCAPSGGTKKSIVSNCYTLGTVSGSGNNVGGIAGESQNQGFIGKSFSYAIVRGKENVGGLVGNNRGAEVENSFYKGSVSGIENVGGIAGTSNGTVKNSYSIGTVTGEANIGGLVGIGRGDVKDSYWNDKDTGVQESAGGNAKSRKEMTHPYHRNTYQGWDFNGIWKADTCGKVNEGYPYLRELER